MLYIPIHQIYVENTMVVWIVFSIKSINRMPPAGSLLLKAVVIGQRHSNQAAEYICIGKHWEFKYKKSNYGL